MLHRLIVLIVPLLICLDESFVQGALVDYYSFDANGDDSAGPTFANGTVGANVTFVPGVFGNAASLPAAAGVSNQIIVPQSLAFNPGINNLSMSFWVQRNNPNPPGGVTGLFDALGGTTGPTGSGYHAAIASNDTVQIRLEGNGIISDFALVNSTATLNDTNWHHVVLTVDRANDLAQFYINGSPETAIGIADLTGSLTPNSPLQIGTLNDVANQALNGRLDELRFFYHVLSAAEVNALYTLNSTAVPEPASLALWGVLAAMGLVGGRCLLPRKR